MSTSTSSDPTPDTGSVVGGKIVRRGFLAGLGAAGLGTAQAAFGKAVPAHAVDSGCCHLAYASTHQLYQCQTGHNYTWTCSIVGGNHVVCWCCEHQNTAGGPYVYSTSYCAAQ